MTEPMVSGHIAAVFMFALGVTIVLMLIGGVIETFTRKRRRRRSDALPAPREDSRSSVIQFRRIQSKR